MCKKVSTIVVDKLTEVVYEHHPNGDFGHPEVWTTDTIVSEMSLHDDKPEG